MFLKHNKLEIEAFLFILSYTVQLCSAGMIPNEISSLFKNPWKSPVENGVGETTTIVSAAASINASHECSGEKTMRNESKWIMANQDQNCSDGTQTSTVISSNETKTNQSFSPNISANIYPNGNLTSSNMPEISSPGMIKNSSFPFESNTTIVSSGIEPASEFPKNRKIVDWESLLNPLKDLLPANALHSLDELKEALANIETYETQPTGAVQATTVVGFFESIRRNVAGFAKETYAVLKNESAKFEMEMALDNLREDVERKLKGNHKIDAICQLFENMIANGISHEENGERESNSKHESTDIKARILSSIEKTSNVLCSPRNRKLMKNLLKTWDLWVNKMPNKVLTRIIDQIARGRPILKLILILLLGPQ